MEERVPRTPVDKLREASPDLADGFQQLRRGALNSGPLGNEVAELVIVGALAATRQHGALRVHIRRLLKMDVPLDSIRQALVLPFAAASTLTETIEALDIFDELQGGDSP